MYSRTLTLCAFTALGSTHLAAAATPELGGGFSDNDYVLALKSDGTVWGWGDNSKGQLGEASGRDQVNPVQARITDVVDLATGSVRGSFILAVRADGTVSIWGERAGSALGDYLVPDRQIPMGVPGLSGITDAAVGADMAFALDKDGKVWAWGKDKFGSLGLGSGYTYVQYPEQIPGLSDIVDLAAGDRHGVALHSDGTVWTWGNNGDGQLGRDTASATHNLPTQVPGLSGIVDVVAGTDHTLALASDGTVWAWGKNAVGQIGDGGYEVRRAPYQVEGLTGVFSISAGDESSLALRGDGSVWAWGNWSGFCCIAPYYQQPVPWQVDDAPSLASVVGTGLKSYGLTADGEVWELGRNSKRIGGNFLAGDTPASHLPTACRTSYFADGTLHVPCADASAAGLPGLYRVTGTQIPGTLNFELASKEEVGDIPDSTFRDCTAVYDNGAVHIPCGIIMSPEFGPGMPLSGDFQQVPRGPTPVFQARSVVIE